MQENDPPINSNGHAHPNPDLATESDYSPPRGNPFPVVGVGASAGGLEAFAQLLAAVPENTGAAFVLVQHLDPEHESLLTQLLTPATRMAVITVRDGIEIKPDHVYVIPPNKSVELKDGHLELAVREPGIHLPIDIFFRSLAQVQGSRAIGVVLSGNASDGSLGVRAIKAECGITFAQDEATARFSGMPRNAIATGAIDFVLPPAEIGKELGRLGGHKYLIPAKPGVAQSEVLPEGDAELKRILALLQSASKVDFALYKPTTVHRRIGRRMMILRIEKVSDYARYVEQKPSELTELYKDLLISVTSFFRDPGTFDVLLQHLAPSLASGVDPHGAVRVWVPGCATGEEVYSLAIALHEFLANHHPSVQLQLFGTDISEPALERARQGLYGPTITENVSESRLRRFFTKVDRGYQINKIIREICVFARQDVIRDPPFSRIDVVSCRNVLIYLDSKAQSRVLPAFHYALNSTGLLMLGSAETTTAASELFTPLDRTHHIYAKKAVAARLILDLSTRRGLPEPAVAGARDVTAGSDLPRKIERLIQNRYSPDAVVINDHMQIVQFWGHTAPYLDPSPGEATLNLLRLAKETLVLPLRRAVQKASESEMPVREAVGTLNVEGRPEDIWVEVTPIIANGAAERCYLVVFIRGRNIRANAPVDPPPPGPIEETLESLQRELAETREYLRSMGEQYEAHAEELQAANEEARSANEELQSTNEELGTTKEELQSANEELTTVNEELQNRNQELAATNSDLRNLLGAVTVAIVMVDQDLRVRRFNAAAEKLLDLGAIDIGRPVGHLRGRIETPRLEEQVRKVIDTLTPTSEEVQDTNGAWYSIGVRPYRTVDDRIAGAVITFQDIDALKRGLEASEEARQYAEALIETVREPLVVLDADLRVQRATAAFYDTFLVSREETEGRYLHDLGNGQWNHPRLRELLGAALFRSEPFHDFEVEHDFPHIGRRTMRLNARRIPRRDPDQRTVLLAIEDVTERREIAEIRCQRLFETAKDGILVIDVDSETVQDVNPFFLRLTGFERENFIGRDMGYAARLLGAPRMKQIIGETREHEIVRHDDLQIHSSDGKTVSVEVVANRYLVGTQPVIQLNVRDISSRKEAAKALAESEERFRIVIESVRDYAIFQIDDRGTIVTWNTGAERMLGWREDEAIGKSAALIFTPEDVERGEAEKELEGARETGRAEDQRWHMRKDGSRFFASGVLTRATEERDGQVNFTKIMQDITSRKEQEDQLRRSVEEKSMLVREIHHRVKNNLQMIVSLLNLQSRHTDQPQVLAAFEETQARVRAVAHIHEQLYASDDLSEVEVGSYISGLARELVALHATRAEGVLLGVDTVKLVLHVEKAIPVALIANELILNSLKHGLNAGSGELNVSLHLNHEEAIAQLTVEDTGPGFPPRFDPAHARSMGFQLITLLVRQLKGTLTMRDGSGASVAVEFPLHPK